MGAASNDKQKKAIEKAKMMSILADEAKKDGKEDGRIVIRRLDGRYVTYANPGASDFSQRGELKMTANEAEAFDFGTVQAAEAVMAWASTKLKNSHVINLDADETEPDIDDAPQTAKKTKRKCFSAETRKLVYRKTEGHCYLCGDFVDYDDYEIEHRIPLAGGGTNDFSNLFCSCHKCNSMKGSIAPEDLMERVTKIFMHQMRTACGDDHAKQRAIEATLAMAGIGTLGQN